MERVIYLLGAGFSAPLGLPVIKNFLFKAKDQFALKPDEYAHFEEVFNRIHEMARIKNTFESDLFDIEEILSILETRSEAAGGLEKAAFVKFLSDVISYYTPAIRLDQSNLRSNNWSDYCLATRGDAWRYVRFIASAFGFKISKRTKGTVDTFDALNLEVVPSDTYRYDIITLNYDMVLENCLAAVREAYSTPLAFAVRGVPSPENSPYLAKLHGSSGDNSIIPPTWSKSLAPSLRADWQASFDLLAEANHLRVLGYSLPVADGYVRYLLKSAMLRSERLKSIDVICLDAKAEVRQRFDSFIRFPEYRFQDGRVEDYLSRVAGFTESGSERVRCAMIESGHDAFMREGVRL